jgi:hypothetical protein
MNNKWQLVCQLLEAGAAANPNQGLFAQGAQAIRAGIGEKMSKAAGWADQNKKALAIGAGVGAVAGAAAMKRRREKEILRRAQSSGM